MKNSNPKGNDIIYNHFKKLFKKKKLANPGRCALTDK